MKDELIFMLACLGLMGWMAYLASSDTRTHARTERDTHTRGVEEDDKKEVS